MENIKGSCLCGSVEYEIVDDLKYAGYCHCSECRRWTGSPFSASGGVAAADFTLLKGKEHLKSYKKGVNSDAYFCQQCSSMVYGDVPDYGMTYVLLGTLRASPTLRPQWHVYTNYKVDWFEINDNLPQHKENIT